MKIRQVCTVYSGSFGFPVNGSRFSKIHKLIRQRIANVMMRRRSLQLTSPALDECTKPAVIAAERMMLQPFASHAAGTVSQTSAESVAKMSIRAPSKFHSGARTQICHSANLFRNLLLCILPQGGKEVDYEVNSLFPGLGTT